MRLSQLCAAVVCTLGLAAAGASGQVVISQVYGGGNSVGGSYNADFIELYNKGAGAVDLSTYSVQYAAAAGTSWTRLNLSGSIPGNGYFLIRTIATGANGAALPAPDVAGTTPNMSATTGKVALVSNQTTIAGGTACPIGGGFGVVDFVGYGTSANCFEGAGNTGTNASITTAALRNSGGCTDNDNNALDFSTVTPTPRNSSTTTGPCTSDADLSLTGLTDAPDPVYTGGTLTYTLNVNNVGAAVANNVVLTLPMPAGLTGFASSPAGAPSGPNYVINLGNIAALGTVAVTVTAQPTGDALLTANFSVSTTSTEPNTANNSASTTTTSFVDAASADIRLSQVYPGGGASTGSPSYTRDFVELYNASSSATYQLGGRSIQYQSETGTTWTAVVLPTFSLQPGQYFLVALGSTGTAGAPLPAVDHSSTSNSLSATAGKVALVNASGAMGTGCVPNGSTVIDFVGWGTVACFEGTGSADWESGDTVNVLYRTGDGCTDADDNSADFRVQAPSPRSSSTIITCGTPRADLRLSAMQTPECQVPLGTGTLSLVVTVSNIGTLPAPNSTFTGTLPANLNPTSAVPSTGSALIGGGGVVTWTIGTINAGAAPTLTITADATAVGVAVVSGTSSTSATEINVGNNVGSGNLFVPQTRALNLLQVIATSVAGAPNSKRQVTTAGAATANIVGVGQVETFSRLYRSPDGTKFAVLVDTDANGFTGDQLMVGTVGPTPTLTAIVQASDVSGAGTTVGAGHVSAFDRHLAINNAGQVAFSGARSDLGTGNDDFVALYTPGSPATITVIAEEGAQAPGLTDLIGASSIVQGLTNDGRVLFQAALTGLAATNAYLGLSDGATGSVVARKGVDAPAAGPDYLSGTWNTFSTSGLDHSSNISGDGASRYISGTLLYAPTNAARDFTQALNGTVVFQEGAIIPGSGFATNANSPAYDYFDPDGHWFTYGSLATSANDYVLRDGVVIAQNGAPIFSGSTELFSDDAPLNPGGAGFAQTFFQAHGLGNDWFVGGISDGPDAWSNAVVVSATGEAFREGDPLDINGNGLDDDDAAADILRDDRMMLGADGYVYAVVQTRAKNICDGQIDIGVSLVRVALGGTPAGCNLADITEIGGTTENPGNPDGQLTVDDIIVFINAFSDSIGCPGANPPNGPACNVSDVTGIGGPPELPDGQLTVDDIIAFFNAFSDGCL